MNQDDAEFRHAADELVTKWARGSDAEYVRLWRRLYYIGLGKTRPNKTYLTSFKKRLYAESEGICAECGAQREIEALEMDRLTDDHHWDRENHFGYIEGNVELVCTLCHDSRETRRRGGTNG